MTSYRTIVNLFSKYYDFTLRKLCFILVFYDFILIVTVFLFSDVALIHHCTSHLYYSKWNTSLSILST